MDHRSDSGPPTPTPLVHPQSARHRGMGEHLTADEVERLIEAAKGDLRGTHSASMLTAMVACSAAAALRPSQPHFADH
jgi:integrase